MAIQISLFNHKGGVSKTTTAFNLGWMLAAKGKKVLLADCDPQCNLTGMVLGFKDSDEFNMIYESGGVRNIREGQTPSAAFQKWIDEIESGVQEKLIPALKAADMLMPDAAYQSIGIPPGKPILQMSDFNSLIALSQKHKVPVFALSDAQLAACKRPRCSFHPSGSAGSNRCP